MNSAFAVLSVAQLNFYVKSLLEADGRLSRCFLRGEISNFVSHTRSGHLYLTLKDETASVRAVMFRGSARGLRFLPADGMRVIASGRVSLYEKDGQYQFYIDDMQPDGVGALYVAYLQLKKKLEAEGLFDLARKRPLPAYPEKIGVVTSPDAAAFQDICNVLRRRWPAAQILLYPAQVQGPGAPALLTEGISYFSRTRGADVVICGRGGGSMEELWAFNDEKLARAIAACSVPVVSAVGHETDFTIADFAADLRAPTPSAAAELVSPDGPALRAALAVSREQLRRAALFRLSGERARLAALRQSRALSSPMGAVEVRREALAETTGRMRRAVLALCALKRERYGREAVRLDALSPLRVLSRGYAAVSGEKGVITGVGGLSEGRRVILRFRDGQAGCRVEDIEHYEK